MVVAVTPLLVTPEDEKESYEGDDYDTTNPYDSPNFHRLQR